MSRTLKYDIPGTDWRRSVTDVIDNDFESFFGETMQPPFEVVLEIGFGRGEFLLELAAKHPEVAYLGIEVSFKRVLKMARKVARARLENVRLVEARGETVVSDCVAPGSLREIWVNFSDPWPKAAHAQRRVIQPEFVRSAAVALQPGGVLHVATDDAPYAEQIGLVLAGDQMLENVHAPAAYASEVYDRPPTSYELDWKAEGRSMHFFDYRRPACIGDPRDA